MKLTFLGAAQTVTGSKTLLEYQDFKILIDCGMYQGQEDSFNQEQESINYAQIDYIFITHAHYDHCGYLPVAIKNGFNGIIYCSAITKDLISIVLNDAYKIQFNTGQKDESLYYDEIHLQQALACIITLEDEFQLSSNIRVKVYDAGHILGAKSFLFSIDNKKIWFSGDIGRKDNTIHITPKIPEQADIAIIESTYGDRIHPSLEQTQNILEQAIFDTKENNGVLLIAAFAIARTQEIIYELYKIYDKIHLPIYIDSPMAINATKVYELNSHKLSITKNEFEKALSKCKVIEFPKDTKNLQKKCKPYILISSSGMLGGGKILSHFEKIYNNKKNTILLTGYQAQNTLGFKLENNITPIIFKSKQINVQAQVKTIHGLSAHADKLQLADYLCQIKGLNKIILNHGQKNSTHQFQSFLEKKLNIKTDIALRNNSFEI
ncbi:MAG: MBL fold metallo-hydrolase [Bacteriovoracaceae bacterium]|jgi:metallo-beta-lactamase family protein|nr:MBL fold metallo-hydrolase [Bacteriovoracaceae bacterium]